MPLRTLSMERRFTVPPEQVFEAWIDPAKARLWLLGTPGSDGHTAEIDARVGGRWRITDRRDGKDYVAEGEYLEMDPPRRLVFTVGMPQFSSNFDTITVEFAPVEEGTAMEFTQAGADIAEDLAGLREGKRSGSERGWHYMFRGLAEVVEGRVPRMQHHRRKKDS